MKREAAIKEILKSITQRSPILASTGKISREVFENSLTNHSELLIPGSMGCTAGVALGLALGQKKRIYALEGDGSVLMNLGTFATIGYYQADIVHFILDNHAHDSTGGQKTVTSAISLKKILHGCLYNDVYENLLKTEIFPGIASKQVSGYRGIQLFRRQVGEEVEFLTIMWFDSWDAVKQFAGEDYEHAYVPQSARKVLFRFDEKSRHYFSQAA